MRTSNGVIFKRCGCRDASQRRLEQSCPRLGERGHGTWYFHCSAANLLGRRDRARRGGYPSPAPARQARDEFLAGTAADRTAEGWTVERWLRHWLESRTHIRATTRFHYTRDVDTVLVPHLGRYRLADLDAQLLRTVFAAIALVGHVVAGFGDMDLVTDPAVSTFGAVTGIDVVRRDNLSPARREPVQFGVPP